MLNNYGGQLTLSASMHERELIAVSNIKSFSSKNYLLYKRWTNDEPSRTKGKLNPRFYIILFVETELMFQTAISSQHVYEALLSEITK